MPQLISEPLPHVHPRPRQGPSITLVAAYRFVDLDDCEALRERLLLSARQALLKGTVLLAPEGINLSLAGTHDAIATWLAALRKDARFADLEIKTHQADALPFKRLWVKVKREIIRMNQPTIVPQAGRAPAVDAATLRRWLDQGHCDAGRSLVMLDTRNQFEVDAGAFAAARAWGLKKFSDFPAALNQHARELRGKTVVSYCTGGIRCEKAALWMAQAGVPHVLQLDGGILRYLEKWPDAKHWHGHCVVFDERQALGADLQPVAEPVLMEI